MTKVSILFSVALCVATVSVNAQRTFLNQTTIDHSVKPDDNFSPV
ncbi:hypothetical protein [Spirosoma spitsbergense]|nr:hypothetical protein [Spirosoma spitsbergense]